MSHAVLVFLTALVLCMVHNVVVGSNVTLTVNPASLQPGLTTSMTLTCSLDDTVAGPGSGGLVGRAVDSTTDNLKYVTSIVVSRDGSDVASMTEHISATALADVTNAHVTGSIHNTPGDRGHIEITWTYPTADKSGSYTCDVTAVDDVGHTVSLSSVVEVGMTSPTTEDLVNYIHNMQVKMAAMEGKIAQMEAKASHIETGTLVYDNYINRGPWTTTQIYHVGYYDMQYLDQTVTFAKAYTTPPVVTWSTGYYYNHDGTGELYSTTLVTVTNTGFTLRVGKYPGHDHHDIDRMDLVWTSFPQ